MQRPQTLVDVAQIARKNPSEFSMALDEFVDEFYLDYPDKAAQHGASAQRLNRSAIP